MGISRCVGAGFFEFIEFIEFIEFVEFVEFIELGGSSRPKVEAQRRSRRGRG
jgi:hypothetical protein